MATQTTNISLTKPAASDTTKIREDMNSNSDIIDGRFSATYMAVQAKASVDIDGGSITGITDLAIADGGTGAGTAPNARTALGLAIGTNIQAFDAGLSSIAGLTTGTDKMIYTSALDTYVVTSLTAFARTILDDADAATVRTTIGALDNSANTIDSGQYVDASIDHEHLAPDVISGMTNVTSENTDYMLIWDATDSALKKCDMGEVRGGAGGTFLGLSDSPSDYTNDGRKIVRVNAAGDALEFVTKTKLDNTSAPTVDNDGTEYYGVGSRWVDVTNDKEYVCLDASTGAAVWIETTATATAGLPVADTTGIAKGSVDATKIVRFEVDGLTAGNTRVLTVPDADLTIAANSLNNLASVAINTALLLGSSDGAALGSAAKMWSDLFLASGGVINFNNGDVTLTHAANTLTVAGGTIALGTATATGGLTGNVTGDCSGSSGTCTGTAAIATGFTCTDNENEALACPIVFVDGATGTQGAETDGDLTYTPSTGNVAATGFTGALTGNADTVTGFTPASGSLTLAGADALTITTTEATGVTLPASGTLLANVSEDTTPTLGGPLVGGDNNITGLGSVSFTQELDNGSKTANFSVDFATDQKQKATLTANTMTLTLDTTDTKVGNYLLKLVNGGLATLTWASESGSIYFPSGTDPSLTSSGTDIVALYFDGTNWYGVATLAFS